MKIRLSSWASLGPFSEFLFDHRSLAVKQPKKMAKTTRTFYEFTIKISPNFQDFFLQDIPLNIGDVEKLFF